MLGRRCGTRIPVVGDGRLRYLVIAEHHAPRIRRPEHKLADFACWKLDVIFIDDPDLGVATRLAD
jgi:hypothetical protein